MTTTTQAIMKRTAQQQKQSLPAKKKRARKTEMFGNTHNHVDDTESIIAEDSPGILYIEMTSTPKEVEKHSVTQSDAVEVIVIDDDSFLQSATHEQNNANIDEQQTFLTMKLSLSGNRYVTANTFKGYVMIHIRQFTEDGVPIKGKGIALTVVQWVELMSCIDGINNKLKHITDENVPDFKHHLGGNKYVRVTNGFRCVDLRLFWLPEDKREVVPTKKGIALSIQEWYEFTKLANSQVPKYVPEIMTTVPCIFRDDHANQMGYLECINCNPNYWTLQLRDAFYEEN